MTAQQQNGCDVQVLFNRAIALTEQAGQNIHTTVEQATKYIGEAIAPIANHSAVQTISKIPGLNWLLLWMGQVDTDKAAADVARLRTQHPMEDDGEIAQRVVDNMAMQAGRVGVLTNIVPSVALALLAVDLVAVTKLQAEMVYRIAAAYGFDINDPVRRGEVIAIYMLSFSTGTPLKTGLSFLEVVPVVGVAIGASSDAVLLYALGIVARQFYETKRASRQAPSPVTSASSVPSLN